MRGVLLDHCRLDRMELAVGLGQVLDGDHLAAVDLARSWMQALTGS